MGPDGAWHPKDCSACLMPTPSMASAAVSGSSGASESAAWSKQTLNHLGRGHAALWSNMVTMTSLRPRCFGTHVNRSGSMLVQKCTES